MLICPQCQFDNPDNNKFCQNCGKSLSYKICPQCSDRVALNQNQCDNCGTKTGVVWRAISQQSQSDSNITSEATNPPLAVGEYLDPQQRYQIIEILPQLAPTQLQYKVLDCQPFQLSLLKADTGGKIDLPELAQTYLTLKSQFGEKIPAVHETWQFENKQIVLISDRTNWQQISDAWHDQQTTPAQIWQWLSDMTELWVALTPQNLRQSLLDLTNVHVSDAGLLGLQCLYVEATSSSLTLQDLGKVWQQLFQESQRTKVGALVDLLADLQAGKIQVVEEVRSRLETVANEQQASTTPPTPPIVSTGEAGKIQVVEEVRSRLETVANEQQASTTPPTPPIVSTGEQADITTSYLPAPTVLQTDESPSTFMQIDDTPTVVLPMQLVSLDDAGLTDVGGQRQHNEDCFGIETAINKLEFPKGRNIQARGLYILCDGMGGHAGGEVASSMAVHTIQQYFQTNWQSGQLPSEESIREAVQLANKAIYDANQQDSRSGVGRMGTTLVLVLIQDNQVAVAHVGDSRLYRLNRKQGLEQVTLDHEVGQREILRGVEPAIAYARPDAYQLTQALGPRDQNYIHPDVQFLELNEDTLLILASDGLSDNNLVEHYWQTHLEPLLSSSSNLEQGVTALIDLANQYNGHDNITAVVIRAKVAPKQQPPQI